MLVYSCSGSSNVAQLANYLAVRLDRLGLAEMSCIVGVGGDVKPLVYKAARGYPIITIDGCPLGCVERVLAAKGIEPEVMIRLHERGLRKRQHTDFDDAEREEVFAAVLAELAPGLVAERPELEEPIREVPPPCPGRPPRHGLIVASLKPAWAGRRSAPWPWWPTAPRIGGGR